MKNENSITDAVSNGTQSNVSSSVYDGLKTEITASKLMFSADEYAKGWNEAMNKALRIIQSYREGKGLFQQ